MRPLILAVLLLSGCGRSLRELKVPPGEARTFVADQNTLWEACRPSRSDSGRFLRANGTVDPTGKKYTFGDDIGGCYDSGMDMIFLEDSCRGAQAWNHERAHRAGVAQPSKEGYDWGTP